MRKSWLMIGLVMILVLGMMFGCAKPAPPPPTPAPLPRTVELATHAIGSVFYATGSGLAKVASEYSGMSVRTRPTAGPPAWVPLMSNIGIPDCGLIDGHEVWQAYAGKFWKVPPPPGTPEIKSPYEPTKGIRMLCRGSILWVGAIVRNDSPIKTLKDLKGKRMTWDFPGFPSNVDQGVFNLYTVGLTPMDTITVSVPEAVAAVRALMEGRVDVAWVAVGMGIISEADARVGVRFLPVGTDPELVKKAKELFPGRGVDVCKLRLPGVKEDIPLGTVPITVNASTHMTDDVAYTLVKTWWEHYKELGPIHPQLRGWVPDVFVWEEAPIPYHPGAIKFYKEKGVWTAEMEELQQRLLKM